MEQENFWYDATSAQNIIKEKHQIESQINQLSYLENNLQNAIELLAIAEEDPSIILEVERELYALEKLALAKEIELMFSGEADHNGCFLEIHPGAGGTDSSDWAHMLFRMYIRWAEQHNFKVSIIDCSDDEEAGIKSATIKVEGHNVYGWLKTESGIHRLVRISPFNNAGKRHTSFASVWVYPLISDDINIDVQDHELRIDTYRSSGAGGQHVNTTDSAVRITHIKTGIVVQSQSNRSQHRNKDECMRMLKSRLYELELQKKQEELNKVNSAKKEIGWGHQIRSYVLHPYQLVKDMRSGHEDSDINAVLDGKLDDFIKKTLSIH